MAMTQASSTHNLPATSTSFIGRKRDLDELAGLFAGGAARLVTPTGAGGCGKTRLALALAARLSNAAVFAHGIWPVELAGLNAPDLVGQTVAAALGLPEARDQPILDALSRYLRAREGLLLLDNCEHLRAILRRGAGALASIQDRARQRGLVERLCKGPIAYAAIQLLGNWDVRGRRTAGRDRQLGIQAG